MSGKEKPLWLRFCLAIVVYETILGALKRICIFTHKPLTIFFYFYTIERCYWPLDHQMANSAVHLPLTTPCMKRNPPFLPLFLPLTVTHTEGEATSGVRILFWSLRAAEQMFFESIWGGILWWILERAVFSVSGIGRK